MRKIALILIFSLLLATPVLAAGQQASKEQAKAWDKAVLSYYEDKYGASDDYENSYVDFHDWTIIDVDASKLKEEAQQAIAEKEKELSELKQQAHDLEARLDYFKSLSGSMEDEDYKKQVEPIIKDTEKSLSDAEKDVEAKEAEIEDLQETEYLDQVAVTKADLHFGGKTLGTMTMSEDQFVDPATGEMLDSTEAKQYDQVTEFLDQQPQVEQQSFHHESVGLFFLALGLAGWWLVSRKF